MRYLPHNTDDRNAMLQSIGVKSINDLFVDVPKDVLLKDNVDLPTHQTELEVDRQFRRWADQNVQAGSVPFFVGGGAYRHHVPASVDHIIQRGEFLTAYTPYQPEIAQGTLQYLFEFQTQVAGILGMDVANASLYDGSTGCGEAVLMARRITRRKKALVSGNLHPHYIAATETLTRFTEDQIEVQEPNAQDASSALSKLKDSIDGETSCVIVQYPDVFGNIEDLTEIASVAHEHGALMGVVTTEIISLGAIKSPGEMGADIAVGEGQSIGNGLNFGGPYLGLFACREKFVRQMPGRLCGETIDAEGKRGFVLTLSTREQHIRREKATSNICTNSGLCSLAFTIHMSLLGEEGLMRLAALNHRKAVQLKTRLETVPGVTVLNTSFFNEFTVQLTKSADDVVANLASKGVLAGIPGTRLYPEGENDKLLILAVTEMVTDEDVEALISALKEALS